MACQNCIKAKVNAQECSDGQRPCARCVQKGLTCDDVAKLKTQACSECRKQRMKCERTQGQTADEPCDRCARRGLACEPHVPKQMGPPRKYQRMDEFM